MPRLFGNIHFKYVELQLSPMLFLTQVKHVHEQHFQKKINENLSMVLGILYQPELQHFLRYRHDVYVKYYKVKAAT